MSSLLYERWLRVAAERPYACAVIDLKRDRSWTFSEMLEELDERPPIDTPVHVAMGNSVDFIFETLSCWRDGSVLYPVERNAAAPNLRGFTPEKFPKITHLKATSGSTGSPRLVLFTEQQLAADIDRIVPTMGLSPDTPNLGVISLSHSYGFSNLVLPLLLHGVPLIWLDDPLPGAVEAALIEEDRWTLPAVPAMWRAWHRAGILAGKSIHTAISAGAPLPLELETAIFEEHGLKVHNFYGSSECGGIAYDRTSVPRISVHAGEAMEGTTLSIHEDGCLVVASPSVASGYLPANEALPGDATFRTTDLARLEEGHVVLEGRSSDQINVAGRKISPERIENALESLPEVDHAVVFGIPSEDLTRVEEVVAIVNGRLDEGALARRILESGTLAKWELPRHWWLTETLIPDHRGKLSRAVWRHTWAERAS